MKTGLSLDVIIPVIATTVVAIMGYLVQIIVLKYNNKKEIEYKRIEAYSNFYLDLITILNHVILLYREYCEKNAYMSWKKFGEVLCLSISKGVIQGDNKNIIENVYLETKQITLLFKNNKYFPVSKRLHKNCMELNLFCVYIESIRMNNFSEKSIQLNMEYINMPDLEKIIKNVVKK